MAHGAKDKSDCSSKASNDCETIIEQTEEPMYSMYLRNVSHDQMKDQNPPL